MAALFVRGVFHSGRCSQHVPQLRILATLSKVSLQEDHGLFVGGVERQDLLVFRRGLGFASLAGQGGRLIEQGLDPLLNWGVGTRGQGFEKGIVGEALLRQPIHEVPRLGRHRPRMIALDVARGVLGDLCFASQLLAVVHGELNPSILRRIDF